MFMFASDSELDRIEASARFWRDRVTIPRVVKHNRAVLLAVLLEKNRRRNGGERWDK